MELEGLEKLRQFGLLFDEREIRFVIPAFRTRRATDEMILVNGIGLGGTTTLCTGNALRMDRDLKAWESTWTLSSKKSTARSR